MTAPTYVNLMERFGSRYRIAFDETDDRTRREVIDPWMLEIRCQRGTIYPYGGETLAVMVDRHRITAGKLASLPSCRLVQDGDHEKTFLFPVADFDKVAAIVLPYRKRQVSDAERDRLRTIGFKTRTLSDAPPASNSRPEVPA